MEQLPCLACANLLDMARHKILIVDDEPKVTFFFQKHLEMIGEGYTVTAVNSGQDALKALKKDHYNLMITDLRMPQMDGLELLRRARKISPNTRTMLVTAYGTADVLEEAQNLNIFRSLAKPLKISDLLSSVHAALREPTAKTSGVLAISGDMFESLTNHLEVLRVDLGARASLLADTTGRILALTGAINDLEISSTMALLGGTMAAASELTHNLKYPNPVHLSYFEGPPYDLYASNVGENFFLTTIHDRSNDGGSRIGLVWLYTRRALDALIELLGQKTDPIDKAVLTDDFAESVQAELDSFFDRDDSLEAAMSLQPQSGMPKGTIRPQPSPTSDITKALLNERLEGVLAQFSQQAGITVESYLDALEIPIPDSYTKLILKTLSESLRNVYVHGQATIVGVSFSRNEATLLGRIADNGVGFDMSHAPEFHSLAKLQQTFQSVGGQMNVSAYKNYGTTVNFQLPLPKQG